MSELADEARERRDRSWPASQKSIQKVIARLSARLEGSERRLKERKRLTQTMTFEDLGVDGVFLDFSARRDGVLHVRPYPWRVSVTYTAEKRTPKQRPPGQRHSHVSVRSRRSP
jgi:hypothetical protein